MIMMSMVTLHAVCVLGVCGSKKSVLDPQKL